jgi:hypothetical protein
VVHRNRLGAVTGISELRTRLPESPQPAGVRPEEFAERWARGDPRMAPHLLLVGRSGAGKTAAARSIIDYVVVRRCAANAMILDWDEEYAGVLPLPVYVPPFEIPAHIHVLIDAIAEVERPEEGGHGVAGVLRRTLEEAKDLNHAIARLRGELTLPRNVADAAASRLEAVTRYIELTPTPEPKELEEGIYLLAEIQSVWERAAVQQFLASYYVFTKRSPVPTLLVIEEGGMGARATFLKHILALARRRRIKIIHISQTLPPFEVLSNFEVLLFDSDWKTRRALGAPIPDSPLRPGECWWVRRAERPVKFRFPSR